jgi:hypothetical protein
LNKASIFRRTSSLILINGGLGLLNPSPGSFLVASIPSFQPVAISEVAWSSTSDRPLVKMLFRLRQGFGGQARCGSVLAQRLTPVQS